MQQIPKICDNIEIDFLLLQSHLQRQDTVHVGLATQAPVHTCVPTYNKSLSAAGRTRRRLGSTSS